MKGNLYVNNDFSTDIKTKIDNLDNALTPYLETHTPSGTEGFIFIILILLLVVLAILQILLTNILCATVLCQKPYSINQLIY